MKKRYDKKCQMFIYACLAVFVIATILGIVKTIFISSDIDEAYAVAQAYRLLKGDRLFLDMWEPHQLSAYLPAIFMKVYMLLTGTTDYIVIWLRIVGTLIQLLLGGGYIKLQEAF